MNHVLARDFPDDETDACDSSNPYCTWNLERCYDTTGYYVRNRPEYITAGSAELPESVWNKLQPGICILYFGIDSDFDFLCHLPETDFKWCGKRCSKIV